ncbi:MAG: restriction endonuclease [Bacteroidales bacterium]|nr:restriction endonuclease [Bacteroidales bacterium]
MLPILKILEDKQEHKLQELILKICDEFELSEEDRNELVPSGVQTKIYNRITWAMTHFKKAGLAVSPKRSTFIIGEMGIQILKSHPVRVDLKLLNEIPAYKKWKEFSKGIHSVEKNNIDEQSQDELETKTPEEVLEDSYSQLKEELAIEIIEKIKECSPSFFERLVVDLLLKMGYGGSKRGKVTGKSGDGGIDGIIDEDKLGLDTIYIQAKKWDTVVGRPEIHKFVGALAGQGAKKGIFITTSNFTKEANEYQPKNDTKIVLINGIRLANLMIEHNVGVATKINYEVKKIDSDYFEEI